MVVVLQCIDISDSAISQHVMGLFEMGPFVLLYFYMMAEFKNSYCLTSLFSRFPQMHQKLSFCLESFPSGSRSGCTKSYLFVWKVFHLEVDPKAKVTFAIIER